MSKRNYIIMSMNTDHSVQRRGFKVIVEAFE